MNIYSSDSSNSGGCFLWMLGIACFVIMLFAPAFECQAKTQGIGFEYRWGPLMGCQIEVEPDKWYCKLETRQIESMPPDPFVTRKIPVTTT